MTPITLEAIRAMSNLQGSTDLEAILVWLEASGIKQAKESCLITENEKCRIIQGRSLECFDLVSLFRNSKTILESMRKQAEKKQGGLI